MNASRKFSVLAATFFGVSGLLLSSAAATADDPKPTAAEIDRLVSDYTAHRKFCPDDGKPTQSEACKKELLGLQDRLKRWHLSDQDTRFRGLSRGHWNCKGGCSGTQEINHQGHWDCGGGCSLPKTDKKSDTKTDDKP